MGCIIGMKLVMDANVLIDYVMTDPAILALYTLHLGQIFIPSVILNEVKQLDDAVCERLGLTIIDEPYEILMAAAKDKRGPLSFQDRVCLLLAGKNKWTCVTNEKPLHNACEQDGITHIWGLRLMIELVDADQLSSGVAMEVAQAIHDVNPRYITSKIVKRFKTEVIK